MIALIRGRVVSIEIDRKPVSNILCLEVGGLGYDVRITGRHASSLVINEVVEVFTHLQVREEELCLFGFPTKAERDLFRKLIQVTGVGTQMALALLHTLGLTDLVKAIITSNIRVLCLAPGIGTKTAERLALELRTKLADYRSGVVVPLPTPWQEEIEMTLLALGYTHDEVTRAMQAVATMPHLRQTEQWEDWLRAAIEWLTLQEKKL
ncbi:MAG: Holliday junction branch migration protein RuvA [Pseudanabaenaceae cyanobacterium SKYGB_i_bin29]|nr:Holliday junction branch migration protein RuvA [Pseudanabaenaceae cyanobacterium SKYG29]MDW8420654.1 Holliday junction branch migration protein RuvA [Pseudanabaenaceae cyanobacterium SKYGB_i_bin29]